MTVITNPPQPNARNYTPGALMRFKNQTYSDLIAAGITPPPYVQNQNYGDELTGYGEKGWGDKDAKVDETGKVPYLIYEGQNITKVIHMPLEVAQNFNLKPLGVSYPPYKLEPSKVTTQDGVGIQPERLSTFAQALDLSKLAGAGTPFIDTEGGALNYNGDPRRQWAILVNGQTIVVGLALLSQNRQGVGHPGHFNFSPDGGAEYFVLDPDPTAETRPPVPVPIRPLAANEEFGTIGLGWQIVRTDMPDPNAPAAAPASDSEALASIAAEQKLQGAKLDGILAILESGGR